MIEIGQALQLVLERAQPNSHVSKQLTTAAGYILAQPIVSDTDTPPFDKALMDGYAVRSSNITAAHTTLPLAGTVTAGDPPPVALAAGTAMLIMTGATVPAGADAVVIRELTQADGDAVTIEQFPVGPEQNLMRAGQICRQGSTVLDAGHMLRSPELGILAEAGLSSVKVIARPTVSVLPTGDELVPVGQPIQPGQIRNSNGVMLCAMADELGCPVIDLGIGRDDRDQLQALVKQGLRANILVLSGGVSAGDLDLVPEVLASCGVSEVFHKVRLKPGKPIWFGQAESGTLVFGLPGNPVSSLVCFRLFVEPAIRQMAGVPHQAARRHTALLANTYSQRGDRPTYFPAWASLAEDGQQQLEVLPWLGSSDLHTFTKANCLAVFPAGQTKFAAGATIEYLPLPALG